MLRLDGRAFTVGRLKFLDSLPVSGEASAKIYVPIRVGDMQITAQLDTGAAWSILAAEVAEQLDLLNGDGVRVQLQTRMGPMEGRLERILLTLVAEEGDSLEVNATVFISPDWDRQNFIGWQGFLERVRFAVDPSPQGQHFYFGEVEGGGTG